MDDTAGEVCTRRAHTFDKRTNRTALSTAAADPGDVALQLPLDTDRAPVALDSEEYGNARDGQEDTRYHLLGAKRRSTETLTGLTLMGVRLYNPATGRSLSVDPLYGGDANAYDHVHADPLDGYDLDGKWGISNRWKRRLLRGAVYAAAGLRGDGKARLYHRR